MRQAKKLSIVVPVYYNEDTLTAVYQDLKEKVMDAAPFACELVLVDDGSGDGSWQIISQLAKQDSRVLPIRLSRNFGSHAAIMCGLAHCGGDCAVIKAADMQEPTALIMDMLAQWETESNVVLAARESRTDKSLFAKLYYWMVQKTAFPQMPGGGFDIFLVDRKVIEVLKQLDEPNTAITGQVLWSGFRTATVYYSRQERTAGQSRWTLKKKLRLVTDTLFGFSTVPIRLVSIIGAASFLGSLLWALVVLILRLSGNIDVTGWTMAFIFDLFSFGVIMLSLGLLGGYLWRTFDASRGRPRYIVEEAPKTETGDNEENAS